VGAAGPVDTHCVRARVSPHVVGVCCGRVERSTRFMKKDGDPPLRRARPARGVLPRAVRTPEMDELACISMPQARSRASDPPTIPRLEDDKDGDCRSESEQSEYGGHQSRRVCEPRRRSGLRPTWRGGHSDGRQVSYDAGRRACEREGNKEKERGERKSKRKKPSKKTKPPPNQPKTPKKTQNQTKKKTPPPPPPPWWASGQHGRADWSSK